MKKVKTIVFVNNGNAKTNSEFSQVLADIDEAISNVTWESKDKFILNPVRKGNGVVPIKHSFVETLEKKGWVAEERMSMANGMNPGPIDAVKTLTSGKFAIEWETGNISSSHRALNKIATGLIQSQIVGGILILPVKNCAQYLTDRIGNYEEIEPYFPMYQNLNIANGYMAVIAIEHDQESKDVQLIPKGKDGNSKK